MTESWECSSLLGYVVKEFKIGIPETASLPEAGGGQAQKQRRAQNELIATKSLAQILRLYPVAQRSFSAMVLKLGIEPPTQYVVTDEEPFGDGRTDVVVKDSAGKVRIVIEGKFAAALTNQQPEGYLRLFENNEEAGLLLFLAPEYRLQRLFGEIEGRCGLSLQRKTIAEVTGYFGKAESGPCHSVGVMSWDMLLCHMLEAAKKANDAGPPEAATLPSRPHMLEAAKKANDEAKYNLWQLKEFCNDMIGNEVGPFQQKHLEDPNLAKLCVDFANLSERLVKDLVAKRWAGEETRSSDQTSTGFYMDFAGDSRWWCGFSWVWWQKYASKGESVRSPFWLSKERGSTSLTKAKLESLIVAASRIGRVVFEDAGRVLIPLTILPGLAGQELLDSLDQQIKPIYETVLSWSRPPNS